MLADSSPEEGLTLESVLEQMETKKMSQHEIKEKLTRLLKKPFVYDEQAIISEFLKEYEDARYALDGFGQSAERCKWYEHEKNLLEFSKKYPEVLFSLSGEGEESGDIWKKYFLNGKVQVATAQIIFEDPDFDFLKSN